MPTRYVSGLPAIDAAAAPWSVCMPCSIGVSVEPGATTLQRMLCRATSSPRHLVKAVVAALDAAYAAIRSRAVPAAFEATVTTAPRRRGIMRFTTAREVKKTPLVLTPKVVDQSWSVRAWASARRSTPAAFTRWSIGPRSRSTVSTSCSTSRLEVTSAG
ncbi:hypothetical protein SAURM35S_09796 [Streptomyces aurantiogriseus]